MTEGVFATGLGEEAAIGILHALGDNHRAIAKFPYAALHFFEKFLTVKGNLRK